jgi:hypothetical protein
MDVHCTWRTLDTSRTCCTRGTRQLELAAGPITEESLFHYFVIPHVRQHTVDCPHNKSCECRQTLIRLSLNPRYPRMQRPKVGGFSPIQGFGVFVTEYLTSSPPLFFESNTNTYIMRTQISVGQVHNSLY